MIDSKDIKDLIKNPGLATVMMFIPEILDLFKDYYSKNTIESMTQDLLKLYGHHHPDKYPKMCEFLVDCWDFMPRGCQIHLAFLIYLKIKRNNNNFYSLCLTALYISAGNDKEFHKALLAADKGRGVYD